MSCNWLHEGNALSDLKRCRECHKLPTRPTPTSVSDPNPPPPLSLSSVAFSDSIPYWVAVLVPLLCLVLSVLFAEIRLHGGALLGKRAMALSIYFILEGIFAFVVTSQITQVGKVLVGRLRPDYLARCNPAAPGAIEVEWAQPASQNPACNPTVGPSELRDGHYSFPSGHTSTAFAFAVYSVIYGVWAFCFRDLAARLPTRRRGLRSILIEGVHAGAALLWVVAQLSFAWGVGISRVIDYRHHPSDVVAGALLGAGFAGLYAARAVGRVLHVTTSLAIEAGDLLPEDPGSMR